MSGADFDCTAYGPDDRKVGALCFISGELHERVCANLDQCREAVTSERQRVFRRIQEGAAQGDPVMVYLAGEFTEPGQILGGSEEADGTDG